MRSPEKTKELIITKAISLFNTKGYRATSLSDITKASGITKGAIYGNFDSKDDVAVAAFEYAVRTIITQLQDKIREANTAPGKLKAIINYYAEYVMNPPISGGCPIINTAVEADDEHPDLRAKVIRHLSVMKDSLKKIIHRGIKEKQIKETVIVDEFALLIYAAVEGAIIMSRVEGDDESYRIIQKRLLREIEEITIKN